MRGVYIITGKLYLLHGKVASDEEETSSDRAY